MWRASLGRPLLWTGAALGGVAVVKLSRGAARRLPSVTLMTSAWCSRRQRWGTATLSVAVLDPTANAELVDDCESLLKASDRLAGTATLNWSAGRAHDQLERASPLQARPSA